MIIVINERIKKYQNGLIDINWNMINCVGLKIHGPRPNSLLMLTPLWPRVPRFWYCIVQIKTALGHQHMGPTPLTLLYHIFKFNPPMHIVCIRFSFLISLVYVIFSIINQWNCVRFLHDKK